VHLVTLGKTLDMGSMRSTGSSSISLLYKCGPSEGALSDLREHSRLGLNAVH
jgi:hypothetical protein